MPKRDRYPQEADTEPGAKKPGTSGPAPKRRHGESAPTMPPPAAPQRPPPSRRSTQKMPATRPSPAARPGGNVTARPAARRDIETDPRRSTMRRRKARGSDAPGATVDEVVADLSKDPRREDD